ncbi:hypothetical protein AX14_004737 [Amanita brunnescens Koide BX004]|nr:hypothetical protein AX14_004737 [Amanita brunnescens Koide BX004]
MFSLVLGAIYMGIFGIELYGLLSSLANRISLVRIYAYLSVIAALATVAAGLLDIVVHFTLKQQIISICAQLVNGDELVYYGFFGPIYHTLIQGQEATQYCTDSWNHDSWATIIVFLITAFLAVIFSSIAFGYLHQLADPTSTLNSARAPSSQIRSEGYPSYYNPPYNTAAYNGRYDEQAYGSYYGARNAAPGMPPLGPPPNEEEERDDPFVPPVDGKPPSYSGDGMEFGAGDDKDDPFNVGVPERDVTSQPTGGRQRFT